MSVLEELIEEIKAQGIRKVARKAHISEFTMYHWLAGRNAPLLPTAEAIANAMGYELKLVPKE